MKKSAYVTLGLLALAGAATAADAGSAPAAAATTAAVFGLTPKALAALALGIAASGGAVGMGLAISGAMQGIGRQPEAAGQIQSLLLISLAFIEALTIYSLLAYFIIH